MKPGLYRVEGYWVPKKTLKVNGWVVQSRLAYARRRLGQERVQELIGALPEDQREIWLHPDVNAWYDLRRLEPLETAVARCVLAENLEAAYRDMGRFSADRAFDPQHGHYRRFRGKPPELFLKLAAKWQNEYYNTGLTEYYPTGVTSCMIRIRYIPFTTRPNCASNLGFFQRSIEILGGEEVQAEEKRCVAWNDEWCEFHFRWS